MKMSKIKLFKVDVMSDGTQRFQSQLYIGKDSVDFIMDNDGVMKCYGFLNGEGFNFYPYQGEFEIVRDIKQMTTQRL